MSGATVTASACTGVDGFGCVLTGQRAWVGVVGVHFARANACAGQARANHERSSTGPQNLIHTWPGVSKATFSRTPPLWSGNAVAMTRVPSGRSSSVSVPVRENPVRNAR